MKKTILTLFFMSGLLLGTKPVLAESIPVPAASDADISLRLDGASQFAVRYDSTIEAFSTQYLDITRDANGKSVRVFFPIPTINQYVIKNTDKMQSLIQFLPSVWKNEAYVNISCYSSPEFGKNSCVLAGFGAFQNN
ncbi:hypothetical protein L465_03613 [Enterobacter sp. BIDMC 29]|uniref:hypothetical protein n=1 Tax=Enterobacter sp. BIDMC 29 TaxID=1329841 RepID=UPI0004452E6B|nr:hypothetical protein [Enterobacter sp. BIDMC 29]EUM08081.1 hypothetical protein L465_03613 [Enterobacter sp. BIDMC 29]